MIPPQCVLDACLTSKAIRTAIQRWNLEVSVKVKLEQYTTESLLKRVCNLQMWCCITVFKLNDSKIGDDGAGALAPVLLHLLKLVELNLSNNDITSKGMDALAKKLGECSTLKYLDLSHNDIGSDGMGALANYLKSCSSLTELNLGNNACIGVDGIRIFGQMIPNGCPIDCFNLSNVSIKEEGSIPLATVLRKLPRLSRLYIAGNFLLDFGTLQIAKVLPQCTALMELDLSGNHITTTGLKVLLRVVARCNALQFLRIDDNYMDEDDVDEIKRAQRRHPTLTITGVGLPSV